MNIVQIHDRVRFWIDTVASARFESEDIDQAVNNAVREIVDEKYSQSRLNHQGDSFQRTQRVRDELSNLVKRDDTDTNFTLTKESGYVLVSGFPTDYKYLLALKITTANGSYNCWPLSYDRENVNESNPFRRVRETPNVKCYFNEDSTGIRVTHPFEQSEPTKVDIVYLADPVTAFYGYEKTPGESLVTYSSFICALSPTSYGGTEYKSGTEVTYNPLYTTITYGLAVGGFVNPDINGFLHEEVAKRAAANCLLTSKDFEKYKAFKAEVLGL